jgi:hypothetical protein
MKAAVKMLTNMRIGSLVILYRQVGVYEDRYV